MKRKRKRGKSNVLKRRKLKPLYIVLAGKLGQVFSSFKTVSTLKCSQLYIYTHTYVCVHRTSERLSALCY